MRLNSMSLARAFLFFAISIFTFGFFALTSSDAYANHEGERGSNIEHSSTFTIGGFYGYAPVTPSDVNAIAMAKGGTPALGSVGTDLYYGGFLGLKLTRNWQVFVKYESQEAKNLSTTSLGANAGYDLLQNELWGTINYIFLHREFYYGFIGAGVGQPMYSHVTENLTSKKEYDADKTLGYVGQIGFGLMLTHNISFLLETGYEKLVSGNIKDGAGNLLTTPTGANATLDLSGFHSDFALALIF